jgi:hypothetical protein
MALTEKTSKSQHYLRFGRGLFSSLSVTNPSLHPAEGAKLTARWSAVLNGWFNPFARVSTL